MGIPVRLIRRELAADGTLQEKLWVPGKRSVNLGRLAILSFAAVPFAGGLAVGLLHFHMPVVAVAGFALWLCQILVLLIYAHFLREKRKPAAIYLVSTFFTFAASYAASFAFASYIFRR